MSRWQVHQKDANEDHLREFLEKHGAGVEKIGQPVDWLVVFHNVVIPCEVKVPGGKLRPSQEAFLRRWNGPWAILTDELDCRWLLSVMTPQKAVELTYSNRLRSGLGDVVVTQTNYRGD